MMAIVNSFFNFSYRNSVEKEVNKIHVAQISSMDCGTACLLMVFNWSMRPHVLLDHLPQPCWTIDLYVFLRTFGFDATLYTLVDGINPENLSLVWYSANMNSSADISRCNDQFALARREGWEINKEISIAQIAQRVARNDTIAICLVDTNFLKKRNSGFAGHYVVLLHYEASTRAFWYLDPAQDATVKIMSKLDLDDARTRPGTDNDIIFIKNVTENTAEHLVVPGN